MLFRSDPVKIFMKADKELGRTLGQLDAADAETEKALKAWGVAVAAAAEAAAEPSAEAAEGAFEEAAADPLPTGTEILAFVDQLRGSVAEQAKALVGLKAAKSAFAGGTIGAAVVLPLLAAIAAEIGRAHV